MLFISLDGLICYLEFIYFATIYGFISSFDIAYFFGNSVVIIFASLIDSLPFVYLEPLSGELIVIEFVCFIVVYFDLGEIGYFLIYFASFF